MASSKLRIWNIALIRIGRSTLTSVDQQNSTTADHLRALWPERLDLELEAFDWDFARKQVTLLDLNEPDELEDQWRFAYAWPGDDHLAIRFVKNPYVGRGSLLAPLGSSTVFPPDSGFQHALMDSDRIPFLKATRTTGGDPEATKIMCSLGAAKARFTYRNEKASSWPAVFVELMAAAMQVELAQGITKTVIASRAAQARYIEARDNAEAFTMQQEEEEAEGDPIFIAGRS